MIVWLMHRGEASRTLGMLEWPEGWRVPTIGEYIEYEYWTHTITGVKWGFSDKEVVIYVGD